MLYKELKKNSWLPSLGFSFYRKSITLNRAYFQYREGGLRKRFQMFNWLG